MDAIASLQHGDLLAQSEHLKRGVATSAEEDPESREEREDEFERLTLVTCGSLALAAARSFHNTWVLERTAQESEQLAIALLVVHSREKVRERAGFGEAV